jgi:hypothetical protein
MVIIITITTTVEAFKNKWKNGGMNAGNHYRGGKCGCTTDQQRGCAGGNNEWYESHLISERYAASLLRVKLGATRCCIPAAV